MKTKFSTIIVVFILGVVAGGVIAWMSVFFCEKCCAHTCPPPPPPTVNLNRIVLQEAKEAFQRYKKDTSVIRVDTLKAFTINMEQFEAMAQIRKNPNVHGFRIYMGIDKRMKHTRMVVGTGSPELTDEIYATSDAASGPCPYCCDTESPIMKK